MEKKWNEPVIIAIILLVAAGLRLGMLGNAPLSDFEADWAMQALNLSGNTQARFGPQPAYVVLTGFLFFMFGKTNFMARFVPALSGVLLVLSPIVLKKRLGWKVALVLAAGLAVDPGLVAVSRLAGSPMLALGFLAIALALLLTDKPLFAGIFGGMALLSGPVIFVGLVPFGAAFWLLRLFRMPVSDPFHHTGIRDDSTKTFFSRLGWGALGAVLFIGSGFSLVPQGIGAFADQFPAYFTGWMMNSGTPLLHFVEALVFYQPVALGFALIFIVGVWIKKDRLGKQLSLVFAVVLLVTLLYPSRQVLDLVWVEVLLWVMAAFEIVKMIQRSDNKWAAFALGGLMFALFIMVWLLTLSWSISRGAPDEYIRLFTLGIICAMIILLPLMAGLGWSWLFARNGTLLGVGGALVFYMLSAAFGVAFVKPASPNSLWNITPTIGQEDLFIETVRDLSLQKTGRDDAVDIVSLVDMPSVQWALRDFSHVVYAEALDETNIPSVIITSEQNDKLLNKQLYRGQDFAWWLFPQWGSMGEPVDLVSWIAFRDNPVTKLHLIVWGRNDLFFDGGITGENQQNGTIGTSSDDE